MHPALHDDIAVHEPKLEEVGRSESTSMSAVATYLHGNLMVDKYFYHRGYEAVVLQSAALALVPGLFKRVERVDAAQTIHPCQLPY
jgi:hypothetical protein